MNFEAEIASMKTGIEKLVIETLSSIRMKLSRNNDFILVDTDDNFRRFFLETAKNKIDYAYNEYLLQAKFKSFVDTSNNSSADQEDSTMDCLSDTRQNSTYNRQIPNSPSADISTIEKNTELQLQNELLNSLYIVGLPLRNDDPRSLLSLVQQLCNHISVPLDANDVESIQSDGYALTVTFCKQYKKDQVKSTYDRVQTLKTDQVLHLLPNEISVPVKIYPKMTEFYRRLTCIAQCFVREKRIFCHRTTSQGLGIMFNRDSEFVYVQSQYELHEHIYQYESRKRKSKYL